MLIFVRIWVLCGVKYIQWKLIILTIVFSNWNANGNGEPLLKDDRVLWISERTKVAKESCVHPSPKQFHASPGHHRESYPSPELDVAARGVITKCRISSHLAQRGRRRFRRCPRRSQRCRNRCPRQRDMHAVAWACTRRSWTLSGADGWAVEPGRPWPRWPGGRGLLARCTRIWPRLHSPQRCRAVVLWK